MIQTNKEVLYDARGQKSATVNVKMEFPELLHETNMYLIHVIDYILENDIERIISLKNVQMPVNVYDTLQDSIISGYNISGTSIEKVKKAMPYALLEYVKNDLVDAENNKLIYGTVAADWELIPT